MKLSNSSKETLLGNWLEGASRAEVVRLFETFNSNVPDFKNQITKVRDNINTVAENKKHLM